MLHTAEKAGLYAKDKDSFKAMMLLTSLRGIHSTGIAGIKLEKGEPAIVKSVGDPYQLFRVNGVDRFFSNVTMRYTTLIGHCRWATRGVIDAFNAHPFREGHIVLAHNGVVNNFYKLRDLDKHKHIDVDSHLIAKLFEEQGAEAVLPKIQGAYVFTWLDLNARTFNIAKNKERPLFGCKLKGKETLIFASEQETLSWNSDRTNVEMETFFEVPDLTIFSYPFDSIIPTETPFKEYVAPKVQTTYHGGYRGGHLTEDWSDYDSEYNPPAKQTFQSVPANDEQLSLLDLLPKDLSIKKDDRLDVEILSYMNGIESEFVFIQCGHKDYPHIKFTCNIKKHDFKKAGGSATGLTATVMTLQKLDKPKNGKYFSSYLLFEKFTYEEDDDEERVQIANVNGDTESITKYRLKELAKHGCAWCQCSLTDKDLADPSKLLLWDESTTSQLIACQNCVLESLPKDE
jgi:hypothetical protein